MEQVECEPAQLDEWAPRTKLGTRVKAGEVTSLEEILAQNITIQEPEIVDFLLKEQLESELILIGQAKGKFGGGARRPFKHTQKKVREGARLKFSYVAVVGNRNGMVGVGRGSSRSSVPARIRAVKDAKLNMVRIPRGCGSWECGCRRAHSIPAEVTGKCGSVRVTLIPAPRGVSLAINDESKKVLELAGVADIWSRTEGQTRHRTNLALATFDALRKLHGIRYRKEYIESAGVML
jgi:small subunit ribosomal protein S5